MTGSVYEPPRVPGALGHACYMRRRKSCKPPSKLSRSTSPSPSELCIMEMPHLGAADSAGIVRGVRCPGPALQVVPPAV